MCALEKAVLFVKCFFEHNNVFSYPFRYNVPHSKMKTNLNLHTCWTAHGQNTVCPQ